MRLEEAPGVMALTEALRQLQIEYVIDEITGSMYAAHGKITIKIVGVLSPLFLFEHENGEVQSFTPPFAEG